MELLLTELNKKEITMTIRIALVIAAAAVIGCTMPAGAEEVGVGVTVGSGHQEQDRDKTVVIKKDHDSGWLTIRRGPRIELSVSGFRSNFQSHMNTCSGYLS